VVARLRHCKEERVIVDREREREREPAVTSSAGGFGKFKASERDDKSGKTVVRSLFVLPMRFEISADGL